MKKVLSALAIAFHAAAFAGFDDGLAAYNAGNFDEALRNWRLLAEHGDANAQFNLGLSYEYGKGVSPDYRQAFYWYLKAAGQGQVDAQNNVGALYYKGQGVQQDYRQAADWYRKAAEQGYANAQFNLARLYDTGQGVVQSYEQAANWYQKAAEQGIAGAQFVLGQRYAQGCGVPQDAQQAAAWHRKAAQSGHAVGQNSVKATPCNGVDGQGRDGLQIGQALKRSEMAATRQITVTPLLED